MTDQIPADQVREILDAMRAAMRRAENTCRDVELLDDMSVCIADLASLLPPPPRPTLAGMTEDERAACQWMQADIIGGDEPLVITRIERSDGTATILDRNGRYDEVPAEDVTPRPDLPRMTWPGTEKPAPALPGGWLLADHPEYGRVIVTNPTPGSSGGIYCVASSDWDSTRFDWHYCAPDTLTFLDGPGTPPSAEPAPEVYPGVTVGEPVTDPQVMLVISIDAPDGTVVVGHTADYHPTATVKSGSTWQSTAGMRAHLYHALGALNYAELESVTVVRWGKETDQ